MADYISLRQLRKRLYPVFDMMKESDYAMKIRYKGKIYILHVEHTNEKPTPRKRRRPEEINVTTEECPECNNVMVNGICVDRNCLNG